MTTPMAKLEELCTPYVVGCAAFWRRGSRLSRAAFRMTGFSPD